MSNPLEDKITQMLERVKRFEGAIPDEFVKDFEGSLNQLIDERVQDKLDAQPVRRTPGQTVAMDIAADELKGNRYQKLVKDIARDGHARIGKNKVKQHHLWMATTFLSGIRRNKPDAGYPGPSDDLISAVKAMDNSTAGAGLEIVAEENARMLWDDFYLASRIVANLDVYDPMLRADPWPIPLGLGDVTWRKGVKTQPTTATNMSTAKSTMTTTELVAEVNWDYTLDEDAVVAMMPAIGARLAISGGEIMDDFALNADATATSTGNINLDDDTPPADLYYLSDGQDGIRHQWLVNYTDTPAVNINAGGDALTDTDMANMFGAMDKYALNPERNLIITDVATLLKGLRILDTVITLDKYGTLATVLTGELARYMNTPIVPSASHRRYEADGKVSVTASNNTLGSITALHTDMWKVGFKRSLLVETAMDIQTRNHILVASFRQAVAAHGTRATAKHTAGIRNIL